MSTIARMVRRSLDVVYDGAGALAGLCLFAILLVITLQVVARWAGVPFPGSTAYAGYFMAAASFLAFAHTLNHGAHIRVNLFLNALGERQFWGELWCLVIGSASSSYMAWYAVKAVYWSYRLNDVSQGQDATPLWIAQTPMAVGAVVLAVCFIDNLATLVLTGRDNIRSDLAEQLRAE